MSRHFSGQATVVAQNAHEREGAGRGVGALTIVRNGGLPMLLEVLEYTRQPVQAAKLYMGARANQRFPAAYRKR